MLQGGRRTLRYAHLQWLFTVRRLQSLGRDRRADSPLRLTRILKQFGFEAFELWAVNIVALVQSNKAQQLQKIDLSDVLIVFVR
jgi:hypothetical protein